MLGWIAYFENGTHWPAFDPLDNDYIEVFTSYWDTGKNIDEETSWLLTREGPELELCSMERLTRLMGPDNALFRQNSVCIKDMNGASIYGDFQVIRGREL